MSAAAAEDAETSGCTASREAFRLWSQVYDDALNPLLSLEQRILVRMLPRVRGLDVLDAGCGTGRWLRLLANERPKTLTGVDASPEMLSRAAAKAIPGADLRLGDCTALPVESSSVDLALACFLLSYIHDLERAAGELARVMRPNANLFLTDMHPETAASCNWRRSFKANGATVEVKARRRTLPQIASIFQPFGFATLSIVEPVFGSAERQIFERGGKRQALASSEGLPAVYILHLRKAKAREPRLEPLHGGAAPLSITGARCAFGAREGVRASIAIERGRIDGIRSRSLTLRDLPAASAGNLDLTGYLALPGLINAHDHLGLGLFPNLGRGPYGNSAAWASDVHGADAQTIEQYRRVPKDVRVWWGAIRNLLCGATTVCHHDPLTPELLSAGFPVRVLTRFGWAHSLAYEPEVPGKFNATPRDWPFIIHAAEGVDGESADEIFVLDRMGVLDERTVLVHGLALSREGISLLNQRGAALIVCPTSNRFLFGRVPSREMLASVANLALGTDSPVTAAGDLLDEIRFAHSEVGLSAAELYEMVTARPSRILRLQDGEGSLQPGSVADLIAVRDGGLDPCEAVVRLNYRDIELAMLAGRVQLASQSVLELLPEGLRRGLQPLEVDDRICWIRAPVDRLFANTERVLGGDVRVGGKRMRRRILP